MWTMVIIISTTLAINASNFETEEHCKIAVKQAAVLEGKAACIWTPKNSFSFSTSITTQTR